MRSIQKALNEIIAVSPFLQFGLHNRVLNLAQTARFLRPLITAKTKKPVSPAAIHMGLSRLQKSYKSARRTDPIRLQHRNVTLYSGLAVLTYTRSKSVAMRLAALQDRILKEDGYFVVTQGTREITLIIEADNLALCDKIMSSGPARKVPNVCGIGVHFSERLLNMPGLIYQIVQLVSLQGVSIIELASTATELVLYIDSRDVQIIFDTLIGAFS